MDIAKQIKFHRNRMDLTQADLAEKLYISSQTVSNWENERSYPDIHNLISLSILFDTSLDNLVKGDVEEMKNSIERAQMNKYSWLMLVFMVMGALSLGPALKYFDNLGFFIPAVLLGFGMYYAFKIEKIKEKYDVKTYDQIVNFLEKGVITKDTNKNRDLLISIAIVAIVIVVTIVIGNLSLSLFR
ncbi:helix-turn-helix domain-containing protein [Macrococcus brunensis]|uniref:helix-turn-helix domain-containing protein n=1 Tax=Macrococcus brunensis TaxID=198483 RepID=UPI001EF113DA|nr:helix-turn-helix transcriptional regulator [Macrococcus brunensis]ULG72216.1 helix-turn-helix domain-containing protein [Macrococcus brunensis]